MRKRRADWHPRLNRVASATRAVAEGKLRRSLARWQEVHGSARVASITRLRAEGHARRKILGRFWRAWVSAQDLQVCALSFQVESQWRRGAYFCTAFVVSRTRATFAAQTVLGGTRNDRLGLNISLSQLLLVMICA